MILNNIVKIISVFLIIVFVYSCGQNSDKNETGLNESSELKEELSGFVDESTIIAFGETSSGLENIHKAASEIFKILVEDFGFRVLLLDVNWSVNHILDSYLNSGRNTFSPEEYFNLDEYASCQLQDLFEYIKAFNNENPNEQIIVAGLQPEQPVNDINNIQAYLKKHSDVFGPQLVNSFIRNPFINDSIHSERDFSSYIWNKRLKAGSVLSDEEFGKLFELIESIKETFETEYETLKEASNESEFLNFKVALISFDAYAKIYLKAFDTMLKHRTEDYYTSGEYTNYVYQTSDSVKYEIFNIFRQNRFKGQKIFLWDNNWNISKQSYKMASIGKDVPKNSISLGTRLAERYGSDYKAISSVVGNNNCTLVDSLTSIERILKEELKANRVFINHSTMKNLNIKAEVSGNTYTDRVGCKVFTRCNFSEQFDATLYIPQSDLYKTAKIK